MEMKPVVVGPGSYASPDPATEGARLVPLSEHPQSQDISEDYGQDAIDAGDETGPASDEADEAAADDEIASMTVAELDDTYGGEEGYPADGKKSEKIAFAKAHEGSN